jgi:hypothetical protein
VVDLGYRPRDWQAWCHRQKRKYSVWLIHRRAGKTVYAIIELIYEALRHQGGDGRFAYVAPELKQAKRNAWAYLKQYAGVIPGTKIHESDLYVELPGGSRISLYGADSPDSLRGIYLDGVVLDELAQMKPDTWSLVVSVALMDRAGWAIFIGTAKGINMLSELYNKALREGGNWICCNVTWRDSGVFSDEEIAEARTKMSEAEFRQEFENDFTAAVMGQILPMDLVRPAIGKHLREETYSHAPKLLGVDVAYSQTGDRSVIFPRQGLAAFRPEIHRGLNNMGLVERIIDIHAAWHCDAIFIDHGRGEGVIHRLGQLGGYPVIPVNAGERAAKPHYQNKRIEMWDAGIRPWLEQGGALPDLVPGLLEDLCAPCFRPDSASGKLQMESSEQLKARGLQSPDIGMALSFTFFQAVKPRREQESMLIARLRNESRSKAVTDHDPYYDP